MSLGVAVFDASPLISFHQVGRFDLLRELFFQISVPTEVAQEVAPSLGQLPAWVEVQSLAIGRSVPGALDVGERAAITLALDIDADFIVLDDLPARRVAANFDMTVVGSLGLLVRAKDRGLVDVVRPIMDEMIAFGLYVTARLYLEIVLASGETE